MKDVVDPAPLVEAAQKAAGDGDYLAAERLLREVVSIQESSLGASHPDLASTLNNLAFVYEQTNKVDEAERGYRRAHRIAVASLPPRHPFIATSLKNLVEFCAAHDIPIWKPAATRPDDETPVADTDEEFEVETDPVPDVRDEPVVVTTRWTARIFVVAALVVAAVVVLAFIGRSPETTNSTPRPRPEARQESSPAPAIPAPTPALPKESPAVTRAQPPEATKTPTTEPPTATAPVSVLNAQLCSALEKRGSLDWQCASTKGNQPGTYFFYTRLAANADTTVEHRWYRGGRVHQVMRLRVAAGSGNGYRTFSSNTISPERAGEWKVELRAADGSLLQEKSFVVR